MIVLATHDGGQPLSTSVLAKTAFVPRKYLEQILRDLKRAELVTAQAGAHGGYRLSRPADQITAGQIVRCLDQTTIMDCVSERPSKPCEQLKGCGLRPLWQQLQDAMHAVLDATSLQQLTCSPCAAPSRLLDSEPVLPIMHQPQPCLPGH